MKEAELVIAPVSGEVKRDAIAVTASAGTLITERPGYFTFISDVEVYILFGATALAITDPDETATSGDGVPYPLAANTPRDFYIDAASAYMKHKGAAIGNLRYYRSGPG